MNMRITARQESQDGIRCRGCGKPGALIISTPDYSPVMLLCGTCAYEVEAGLTAYRIGRQAWEQGAGQRRVRDDGLQAAGEPITEPPGT